MSNAYEKEITANLGNSRNLILLGCRADADIDYHLSRISTLEAQLKDRDDTIMRLERFTRKQARQLEACAGKLKEADNEPAS